MQIVGGSVGIHAVRYGRAEHMKRGLVKGRRGIWPDSASDFHEIRCNRRCWMRRGQILRPRAGPIVTPSSVRVTPSRCRGDC